MKIVSVTGEGAPMKVCEWLEEHGFRVEVLVAGETEWCSNELRFETRELAEAYGRDLTQRWRAVRDWRVAP